MQNHKKLSARILSFVLSMAMVGTMMPATVFATDANTPNGTPTTTSTITAFDELGKDFEKSVPFDGHTYVRNVQLNTPFEDVKLPTELGVTVEKTTTPSAVTVPPTDKPNIVVTQTVQEKIPVTWKGDSKYTPDQNSKVIYTAELPKGYALKESIVPPTINVMVGRQARATKATTPVKRTSPLDLTATSLTYMGTDGVTSATADPTTTSIPETGEGWSWDSGTKTLTLDGANIDCTGNSATASNRIHAGIMFPTNCKIVLADGSTNTVIAADSNFISAGIFSTNSGNSSISGNGTLTVTGKMAGSAHASYGIGCERGALTISDATITASSTITRNGGANYGILADLTITSGNVTAIGTGNSATSYGIKSPATFTMTGGTLSASSTQTAVFAGQGITAKDATVTGSTEGFTSGTTSTLTQADQATPVIISFTPKISFDARNGGATIAPMDADANGKITPPTPTWTGYTFGGWYTGIDGTGTAVTADTVNTASVKVYAKWIKGAKTVRTEPLDLTKAVTNAPDQGWTWNSGTKTLTLDGANIRGENSVGSDVGTVQLYAVNLPADAFINLVEGSENNLISGNITGAKASTIRSCGIYVNGFGTLTINGTGTLNTVGGDIIDTQGGDSYGIYSAYHITIDSGTVNATGGTVVSTYVNSSGYSSSMGIITDGGQERVTIGENATVTATGGNTTYNCTNGPDDGMAMSVGILTSDIGNIFSYGKLTVVGGTAICNGTDNKPIPAKAMSFGTNSMTSNFYTPAVVSAKGVTAAIFTIRCITANGATATGANEGFTSGTTSTLTQADQATPVIISFTPKISFDARNGATIAPIDADATGKITPPTPTWTGYTFGGWYTGIDGTGTAVTADTAYTASATVYAKWIKGTKTVRTEPLDLNVASVTPAPDQGWSWDSGTKTLTLDGLNINSRGQFAIKLPSNATITASGTNNLTLNNIDVDYVADANSKAVAVIDGIGELAVNGTGTININSKYSHLSNRNNGTVGINSDTNLKIDGVTINIDLSVHNPTNLSSGLLSGTLMGITSINSLEIGTITAPKISIKLGDSYSETGISPQTLTIASGNVTVESDRCIMADSTLTGGNIILKGNGQYANVFAYGNLTADGATILGSKDNITGANAIPTLVSDILADTNEYKYLSFSFTPKISFDARNGATIAPIDADATGKITPPTPTWTGYTFGGWYTGIDGTGTAVTADTVNTASVKVYAKWIKGAKTVRTETLDLTKAVTNAPDQGWTWNSGTKTLTLDGATIDCSTIDYSDVYFAIKLPDGATITASGTNTLMANVSAATNYASVIYGLGALTINGSGTIKIGGHYVSAVSNDTSMDGIEAVGALAIDGVTLNISPTCGTNKHETVTGIYSKGDTTIGATSAPNIVITLVSDAYSVTGLGTSTRTKQKLIMNNGTLSISTPYGSALYGNANISGGSVILQGTIAYDYYGDHFLTADGATIMGSKANADGSDATATVITDIDNSYKYLSFSFGPSISVGAQTGTATYGTATAPTFAVTSNNFGIGKYPAFAPKFEWVGTAPTGVTTTISGNTLTINTTATTPQGEYKFKVVSPKTNGGNYESAVATLKVDKLIATILWTGNSFTYNGKAQAPTATVSNAVNGDVLTVTVAGEQTNVGSGYTATARALNGANASNYAMPTPAPTQAFEITKATYIGRQAAAPSGTPTSKTDTSITINSQSIDGETVEYGIKKPDGTTTWQASNVFNSLTPDTEYTFYARVKDTANHNSGTISAGTKIKTDMSDAQKIAKAKTAVENALNKFTATNATDESVIMAVVNKALTDAGITDVTPSWDVSGAFNKTNSTDSTQGSVTGKINLVCGTASAIVDLNRTIEKLPNDSAGKIATVKKAIEDALNAYTATNATTDADIKTIVDKATLDSGVTGVTVEWKTPSDFNNKNSTNSENGKVTGTFNLSCGTENNTVSVNCPIERTDVQKLADAKAKAELALKAMTATNATTADDVMTVVNDALSGTGVTVAWKSSPNGFKKTLATENAAGNITGKFELTLNGKNGEVDVNLTIARITADKTALTKAITDANNAKNGIAISNASPSSVSNGARYVSKAEMQALTDAIAAAQTVANNSTATTAQVSAAISTLNTAVNTFKSVIKTGTYISSGGSNNNGGSTGTDTTTPPTETIPDTTKPPLPTTVETELPAIVDSNGNASVTLSDNAIDDIINKARAEANKNGTIGNGIAIILNVTTGGNGANTVAVNLPKTVQEKIIAGNVLNTILIINRPDISINMNLASITELNRQANSDVQLTATRIDSKKLKGDAKKAIGGRAAFDLKATFANGTKSVNNFGNGRLTIGIPYTLQKGEVASGLYGVYADGAKANYITNSSYDVATKTELIETNHLSVYGIGYKAPIGFKDITNHWAKSDIEFVVNRGLFNGTSKTKFSPNSAMTRGMFVTALGKMANADISNYKKSSFNDVKANAYNMGYIEWASKNGILKGIGNGKFAPNQSITREQMAVIIESYAKTIGFTLPSVHTENAFADSGKISSYAKDSVKKVQMAGIISGKNGNVFDPQGTATRAEVSAMLHRFIELVITTDSAQGWTMNDSGKWMFYENGKAVTGNKNIDGENYTFNQFGEVANVPKHLGYGSYTVKKGDSFWRIANRNKCNMFELARINGKTIFSMIHPGDVLKIPQ